MKKPVNGALLTNSQSSEIECKILCEDIQDALKPGSNIF